MRRMSARMQGNFSSGGNGAVEMALTVKRMAVAGAGLLGKAIPVRGGRRYATVGFVVALAASGTVTAVTALPAQAAHVQSARAVASARDDGCTPPPSPALAGFRQ